VVRDVVQRLHALQRAHELQRLRRRAPVGVCKARSSGSFKIFVYFLVVISTRHQNCSTWGSCGFDTVFSLSVMDSTPECNSYVHRMRWPLFKAVKRIDTWNNCRYNVTTWLADRGKPGFDFLRSDKKTIFCALGRKGYTAEINYRYLVRGVWSVTKNQLLSLRKLPCGREVRGHYQHARWCRWFG
jgi:hypothetical protein